ncbi:MAG: pyridoxal kinase [Cohaesibacteraceae bacterium]
MNVISIQSQVVHGCVGNNAAVLPMQAHGLTVAAVPTTLLSNHPHYPTMRGQVLDADCLADLLRGVEERGLANTSTAIISGFLGSPANGEVVADFVARAKQCSPDLIYILDPVAGDEDIGAFAGPELIDIFRRKLLPLADIITPNRWELRRLAASSEHEDDLLLARQLMHRAPSCVIITGGTTTGEELTTLVVEASKAWDIRSPRIDVRAAGTGDLFTGLFTARLVSGDAAAAAASYAVAATFGVLEQTPSAPWSELPIAACLRQLRAPARMFPAVEIAGAALPTCEKVMS